MVDQYRVRDIDITPAGSFELQAETDVIVGDGKILLVEAANGQELAFVDQQACTGNRADELSDVRVAEVARIVRGKVAVGVAGGIADADDDTRVLDAAV